ncbi:ROK family protein [Pedococcus sp. 5OH_020]|uniref:ROK family protein n=1 Tax=Pedococcus sp. 5OH_020 TaxID=2989814 RepID=UPI0022E9D0EA|nr:ROK family protein [Pedococcus sp. 5OH_020]
MSAITRLVASATATTRADLVRATGLARSTVTTHLDQLLDSSVVLEEAEQARGVHRGRPANSLALSSHAGFVMVVDMGIHRARLAVADLSQRLLSIEQVQIDPTSGPVPTLALLGDVLMRMAAKVDRPLHEARAVVVGLPAPVDVRRGMAVRPPIMPGWDEFPVAETMSARFGCTTVVQNDVNLMAVGEARALPAEQCPLLFIKVGTGIGGGLVSADGNLHLGADGAAGDIGHIRVPGAEPVVCACGNIGCIEAVASADAILRQLSLPQADPVVATAHVEQLLRQGDADTVRLVREAAVVLGEVVATLVHFYNPSRVVLGGAITSASDHLLAGVRGVVYQRALPLATRNLTLAHSVLGARAGIAGGVVIGVELVLSPTGIRALL